MLRIFPVILILVALVSAMTFWKTRQPVITQTGALAVIAEPLVLDSSEPSRTRLGDLHFLGAWRLSGTDDRFGGLSSMRVAPDGSLWSLNDTGTMFHFPQPGRQLTAQAFRLLPPRPTKQMEGWPFDSESMAVDPAFRHIWVGYELVQRICRYGVSLKEVGTCRDWPEMKDWPITMSLESMERLPDGRFLVIAEGQGTRDGRGREGLLFAGDPVDPETPHPVRFTYVPPVGYDPTDAVYIGGGKLLVLNRRATLYDGFTAVILLVDIRHLRAGAVLTGREVARLAPPVLADNFEGMALDDRGGQKTLWVVSDDNHLFFQRTLLLKFALPDRF